VLRADVLLVSDTTERRGGVQIRRARPGDLGQVLALLEAADLPAGGVAESFTRFSVGEAEGRIVAAVGLERHGSSALLRSLVVEPGWRGRGAGNALVEDVLRRAQRDGLGSVYLLTTTAAEYFPRFGFRSLSRDEVPDEVRQSDEFAWFCPASAVVMVRSAVGPD
jgi:amino-acid N-acetyltransferase